MAMTRSGFWKDLWALLGPYWRARDATVVNLSLFGRSFLRVQTQERFVGWGLLLLVVTLTLAIVYNNVLFNQWYNVFYNALQERDKPEFYRSMWRFGKLATLYILMAVYAFYLNQMLQIRWRRWLTDRYLKEWLSERTYYRMQLTGAQTDNPDQRIAEDMRLFVDDSLDLSLGFLNAAVTLASFVGILWALSGPLEFAFNGQKYELLGYMVWVALGYAIAGTWLTHMIGRPLIGLKFKQQRYEADFRFNLARFRENTEGVALYRGEEDELRGFRSRFAYVFENWWQIMRRQKLLNTFTIGYSQVAVVFPFLAAAPRYFSGAFQLGGLMQISNAFGQVQGSLSWFISAYSTFASWRATVDRLTGFHNAVVNTKALQQGGAGAAVESAGDRLELDRVELGLPSGETLMTSANAQIPEGARVLIQGPSGAGKSTLFRAVAGIWPFVKGTVRVPEHFHPLFLPQRPYFPLGTLRQAVSYPAQEGAFTEDQVRQALIDVGLPHLPGRLDEASNWSMQLSGGEQQRVAFARALLHQPKWLFLDEATSNLDTKAEAQLYRLLIERLQGSTIISIAHRPEVASFHSKQIELKPQADGSTLLIPVPVAA